MKSMDRSFGIASKFDEKAKQFGGKPRVRIIRMRKVPFMDSTGLHNLQNFYRMSKKEGIQIVLSGVNKKVHKVMDKSGFSDKIGQDNICSHIDFALERANELLALPVPDKHKSVRTRKKEEAAALSASGRRIATRASAVFCLYLLLQLLASVCRNRAVYRGRWYGIGVAVSHKTAVRVLAFDIAVNIFYQQIDIQFLPAFEQISGRA